MFWFIVFIGGIVVDFTTPFLWHGIVLAIVASFANGSAFLLRFHQEQTKAALKLVEDKGLTSLLATNTKFAEAMAATKAQEAVYAMIAVVCGWLATLMLVWTVVVVINHLTGH